MFPLVHYFVNREIYKTPSNLLILGGLWPDLAFGAGLSRDQAHAMGADFHAWCREQAPAALDLARGILSHGSEPHGVDYYADEFWPGYRKGWCFMQGEAYMDRVAAATGLPQDFIWWKAHNFVELAYELITHQHHAELSGQLMAALSDRDALSQVAGTLSAYHHREADAIIRMYENAPQTFAIAEISPHELARKQKQAFLTRHGHSGGDIAAMAALLGDMQRELEPGYHPFMRTLISLTANMLEQIEQGAAER